MKKNLLLIASAALMTSAVAQNTLDVAEDALTIDEETVAKKEAVDAKVSYLRPDGVFFITYSAKRSGLTTAYTLGPAYADVKWEAKAADGAEVAYTWNYLDADLKAASSTDAVLTTNYPYGIKYNVPQLTGTAADTVQTFCMMKPSTSETAPGPIYRAGRGCPSSSSSGLIYAGNFDTKFSGSVSTNTSYFVTNSNVYKLANKYTKAKYADEANLNWFGDIFEYGGVPYTISAAIIHGKNTSATAPAAPVMNVAVRAVKYTEGSTSTSLGDTLAIGTASPVETNANNKAYSYLAELKQPNGEPFAGGRMVVDCPIAVQWSLPEEDTESQFAPYYSKQNSLLQPLRKSYACFGADYSVPADEETSREASTGSLWGRISLTYDDGMMLAFTTALDVYYSYAYCETAELEFAATEAEPQVVEVETPFVNTSVQITLSDGQQLPEWIHVTPDADKESPKFTISVDDNTDEEAREETIMFTAREATHSILISQAEYEGSALQQIESEAIETPAYNLYGQKAGKNDAVVIKSGKIYTIR